MSWNTLGMPRENLAALLEVSRPGGHGGGRMGAFSRTASTPPSAAT